MYKAHTLVYFSLTQQIIENNKTLFYDLQFFKDLPNTQAVYKISLNLV